MLRIDLKDGNILVVDSKWDSGTHCGFHVSVAEKDSYNNKSLDKVLSKEQIQQLEVLLIGYVYDMLKPTATSFEQFDVGTDVIMKVSAQEISEKLKNSEEKS